MIFINSFFFAIKKLFTLPLCLQPQISKLCHLQQHQVSTMYSFSIYSMSVLEQISTVSKLLQDPIDFYQSFFSRPKSLLLVFVYHRTQLYYVLKNFTYNDSLRFSPHSPPLQYASSSISLLTSSPSHRKTNYGRTCVKRLPTRNGSMTASHRLTAVQVPQNRGIKIND